jgi:hypothetical protein
MSLIHIPSSVLYFSNFSPAAGLWFKCCDELMMLKLWLHVHPRLWVLAGLWWHIEYVHTPKYAHLVYDGDEPQNVMARFDPA